MFSLFLPERCLHCEEPTKRSLKSSSNGAMDRYLCEVCARILEFQDGPGEEFLREQFYLVSTTVPLATCRSKYWFNAESPVQSIIHAMKYSGMPKLARHSGGLLAPSIPSGTEIIVPVPLHRTRMAERGYNQAESLAQGMAEETGATVLRALRRTRPTPSQTHLSIHERIENVRGAFALSRAATALEGKNVLLIDDVMTTGSTLASAAEVLLAAKPKSISIVTLAAAQK